MAVVRTLGVIAILVAVATAPCLLCTVLTSADKIADRFTDRCRSLFHWVLRTNVESDPTSGSSPFSRRRLPVTRARPIELIAADLRRLHRHRSGIAMRSQVWFTAVRRAYDDRLCVACGQLGIEQHLGELTGIDLDLERVRVEGLLLAAGLAFRDSADRRHGPR
jgi:hypothetical protein